MDKAFALAQEQKKRVDPMYHEKIDSLLDTYARKLAANMNHGYEIDARVPSILIAGGSNFPVRQKEKQNAARDSNMQEWQYIQAGYEVAVANDGVEALSLFAGQRYDLIVLDIMLPKIDGYGVCELIRKQSDVPIIMLICRVLFSFPQCP